jgi:hypothetical protein
MTVHWLGLNIARARGQPLMDSQNQLATVITMVLTRPAAAQPAMHVMDARPPECIAAKQHGIALQRRRL